MSVQTPDSPIVAFYAPLKPVDHKNPSGDRHIARLFVRAIVLAGFQVETPSTFRSLDIKGNNKRQKRLQFIGQKIAKKLIVRYKQLPIEKRPSIWFTYHLYHKAADWLGPLITEELNIPYVIAEASYAAKQYNGPWHIGLLSSQYALHKADCIFCINPADISGIKSLIPTAPIKPFKLFIETAALPSKKTNRNALAKRLYIDPKPCWLICVAMMRCGDKFKSYEILAASLRQLALKNYRLLIIGDGSAHAEVSKLFDDVYGVSFLGKLESESIMEILSASDLFVWPAVNEALGMAILEAQACGTPVLAGNEGGIASITSKGQSAILVKPRDVASFSHALNTLISKPAKLKSMGQFAHTYVQRHHSLSSAARILRNELENLLK